MNGPQSDHVVSCKAVRVACKTELSKMRSCLTFLNAFSLLFLKFLSVLRLCYLMSDAHYNPNHNSSHHRDGDVYHNPGKSSKRGNCFLLPDQWQNKRYGDVTHLHKKVLITDHVMYQSDGIVLGQRNTTIICRPRCLADIF